jgi:hypothetical protein
MVSVPGQLDPFFGYKARQNILAAGVMWWKGLLAWRQPGSKKAASKRQDKTYSSR